MTEENIQILFFCRDCQKVVDSPEKQGNKYEYKCPLCKSDKVAFGTRAAICDFFHIKEAALTKMLEG